MAKIIYENMLSDGNILQPRILSTQKRCENKIENEAASSTGQTVTKLKRHCTVQKSFFYFKVIHYLYDRGRNRMIAFIRV